jgi:hypothetical protein
VRGTDSCSRNDKRDCGVSHALQLRKHVIEPHASETKRIFKQAPSRPEGSHGPQSLWPEPAVICRASSLPGNTRRLARWSSGNKVNRLNRSSFHFVQEAMDISVPLHVRPVLLEHLLAELVSFHLPDRLHSGPLQAERKTADTGK